MRPASPLLVPGRRLVVAGAAVAAFVAATLVLTGCQPEPASTASPSASVSSPSPSPSASSASPTPVATDLPDAGALPASCEAIYSPALIASMAALNRPLNDPGVTMTSTQNVEALEILSSGIPTIRCSWGVPSETGLATNVSIVDAKQSAALVTAFGDAGFGCESVEGGTRCRTERTVISQEDTPVTIAEDHYLRDNRWISTTMIDFAPEGYTEDVIATLWG